MSRSGAVLTVLALLAVVVLAACGSSDSGGSSTADNAAATSSAQPAPAPAAATTSTPTAATTSKSPNAIVSECHKAYDLYITKLRKVDASVDGTPNYRAFGAAMTKVAAIFQKLEQQPVPSENCQNTVGGLAGSALLQFGAATAAWSACRPSHKCAGAAMRNIRARWAVGSDNIVRAREGYTTLTAS